METDITQIPTVLEDLMTRFIAFVPNLIISLIIFIVSLYFAGLISRLVTRWLEKRDADAELTKALGTITRWTLYIMGTTVALNQVGFNLTAFLTGLGILGFTVGFAIQDVSKNFVAGLLLLIEQPFDIGDAVEVSGFGGVVEDVDLRATQMRTFDGLVVQIPNADIFTSPITNYSRAGHRRLKLNVGVAYGTDLEYARSTALAAINALPGVQPDPAAQLVYGGFGSSTIDFSLYYWIDTEQTGYFDAQDGGVVAIERAFSDAGIEIPYPIQTVINKSSA